MLPELVRVIGSGKVSKHTKQQVYKDGFFFSAGLFLGIGLNDVFRLLAGSENYKKLVVAGKESPFVEEMHMDELYQYAIIGGVLLLSAITNTGFAEALPASAGAATGIAWSNHMERKGVTPISLIPV